MKNWLARGACMICLAAFGQARADAAPSADAPIQGLGDKSGTTFLFTSYLSAVSPAWKAERGVSDTGTWPEGLVGQGNAGVPDIMKSTVGTIGYVEFYYATRYHLDVVLLKNHAGRWVEPDPKAFKAAAAGADWSKSRGFYLLLLDQPGAKSWPITAATFALVRKDAPAARREQVLQFFDWTHAHGDKDAETLDYVPLPPDLKKRIETSWKTAAP
jgi:phosphate transport system substrate-binding protein